MAVEVLDYWSDLDSVFGYSLRKNGLVSKVGNERGALLVENQAGGLASSWKRNFHLSFIDLIDVTIGRNGKQITFRIFSGTVEGNC